MTRRLLLFVLLVSTAAQAQLTVEERQRALQHLQGSRQLFLESIAGLTEAQWKFKPAPDRWSIAECAEHIGVSEEVLFELVSKKILSTPPAPEKKAEVKGKDEQVVKMVPDRSSKFQAPEFLRPTNRWSNRETLTSDFNRGRDRVLEFVRTTPADLRSHFLPHPVLKTLDGYQWVLLLSAHTERHTAQINEVKAHPDYPKEGAAAPAAGASGKSHFLVMLQLARPTLPGDASAEEYKALAAHGQYVEQLYKSGKVLLAGPRLDFKFGLIVVEASGADEVQKWTANDPGVKAGLFKSEVVPFRVAFDRANLKK